MTSHGKAGLPRARVKFTDDVDQTPLDYRQPTADFPKDLRKQNAEQNRKPRSWLFQGWRSKNSSTEDVIGNKNNSKGSSSLMDQYPVDNRRGHGHHRANESLPGFEQSVPPPASRGEAVAKTSTKELDVETKTGTEELDEEEIDKDAEHFIGKMRHRMDMERWKSMKRYESMLNRGY